MVLGTMFGKATPENDVGRDYFGFACPKVAQRIMLERGREKEATVKVGNSLSMPYIL